jgi:hypothetical protein
LASDGRNKVVEHVYADIYIYIYREREREREREEEGEGGAN